MIRKITIISLLLSALGVMAAEPTIWQLGSVYYAYPESQAVGDSAISAMRQAGYAPFYVGHYGRHGSRWLTTDQRYLGVVATLDSLNEAWLLTPLGQETLQKTRLIAEAAKGHGGELSPIGEAQHRGIAKRMVQTLPEVFAPEADVRAQSSTKMRCAMSMTNFLLQLASMQPTLRITATAYPQHMDYISHTSPDGKQWADRGAWKRDFIEFTFASLGPGYDKCGNCKNKEQDCMLASGPLRNFLAKLITEPDSVHPLARVHLMNELYWMAEDEQNVDSPASLMPLFDNVELEAVWRTVNARMYMSHANAPAAKGVMMHCADSLLANIVMRADEAATGKGVAADLRFGHDSDLLRLLALIGLEQASGQAERMDEIENVWRDYELSPMAANLQFVLFKSKSDPEDVRALILLNEQPARISSAFGIEADGNSSYSWPALKEYLHKRISE